jgi:phage shock protein C
MTQQPYSQQPYRQLRRSQADRKIGGVCAGVGEYFGVDPTLVRVAAVIATVLTGGAFILAYLIAFVIMPDSQPVWPRQPYPSAPTPPSTPPTA